MTFHRALYGIARSDAAEINAAAARAGVNPRLVDADKIASEITANLNLQRQLQLTGTPSWVIGDTVLNGAVGYDAIKKAIAETRAKRG